MNTAFKARLQIYTLTAALITFFCTLTTAEAGIMGHAHWLVKSGDSVYSIARKMYPNNKAMQARFRKSLVKNNPEIFQGNANLMSVGSKLKLPTFALVKSKPKKTIKPKIYKKHTPTPVQIAVKKPKTIKKPVPTVTPDPEDVIGHVVINIGKTEAINRGDARRLTRHSKIYKGDTLKTLSRTHTQIRFKDGALISLRPNTEFLIAEYNYNGREDGSERGIFELIKGGFRTITGAIGHRNKQNYKVKTSVATIGIRGTHYGLMLCDANCQNIPGTNDSMQQGLYGGVVDGGIVINNDAGQFNFNNDQYFHVANSAIAPVEQLIPPPVFNADPAMKRGEQHPDDRPDDMGPDDQNPDNRKEGRMGPDGMGPDGMGPDGMGPDGMGPGEMMMHMASGDFDPNHMPNYDDQMHDMSMPPPMIDMFGDIPQDNFEPMFLGDGENLVLFNPEPRRAPLGAAIHVGLMLNEGGGIKSIGAPISIGFNAINEILLTDIQVGTQTIGNIPMYARELSYNDEVGQFFEHEFTTFDPANQQLQPDTFILPSSIGGSPIGVNWGRWAGNYRITENGNTKSHTGDLHFIYSENITPLFRLQELANEPQRFSDITAVVYTKTGGTVPTNEAGNLALSSTITATANFTSQQLTGYDVKVDFASQSFHANQIAVYDPANPGTPTVTTIPFNNLNQSFQIYGNDTGCTPTPCVETIGEASFNFVGGNAEGAITSFGVSTVDGASAASGAALLTR